MIIFDIYEIGCVCTFFSIFNGFLAKLDGLPGSCNHFVVRFWDGRRSCWCGRNHFPPVRGARKRAVPGAVRRRGHGVMD